MAIFGTLGKVLGLGGDKLSPFEMGIRKGLAEGVTDVVKDDMKRADERVDRIADYRIRKTTEEQERFNKELRENMEAIRGIAGKAGGINGAEWLIRTYGIEEAITKASQFETLRGIGKNPEFLLDDENATTFEDLAKFVTASPAVFDKTEVKDTGLLSKIGLGRDLGEEAQREVDAATSALGYGRVSKPELGVMPTVRGFDPADLGTLADMKDESHRQLRLAIAAKEAGDEEAYKNHLADATTMTNMLRMANTKDVTEAGSRANMNGIITRIERVSGVEGDMVPDGMNGVRFKAKFEDIKDQIKVNNAGSNLNELYAQAIARQISPATALRVLAEAEGTNRLPKIVPNDDGSFSFIVGTEPLIKDGLTNGTGAYAPPPPPPSNTNTSATATTAATTQSSTTQTTTVPGTPADLQNLTAQANAAASDSERAKIKAQIGRRFGPDKVKELEAAGTLK
jgi:hypothetical protein|tara:strand:- start:3418 stop:4782 length:1365 start_codon:yes stop_codon:yes gene_type:complete